MAWITNAYTHLVSSAIFPLHERLKKHSTVAVRKAMEESQWWSPRQLREYQLQRAQEMLGYVGQHVPYYRRLFESINFDPASMTDLTALQRLPLTTKKEIREHLEDFKAAGAADLARFNTGGSSGEPLVFFIGKERVSHDVAAKWRATRWWGVDIGDPEIVVWGSPIELGKQDRIKLIRDRLLRTTLVPAFNMSSENLDRFVKTIIDVRPKMLFGYPSSLALIGSHAEKRAIRMDKLGIKVAFVTSERLYDHQRETIERVFGCPVANGYGGRDAGFIAHQCPAGSMHITAEDIIVEIVDQNGQVLPEGSAGEIVVTHLATRDYPFLRYKTGDIGTLSSNQCSCGRGLPILSSIEGRTTDFIVARDGTIMHGLSLIYVVRDVVGVEQFKIVQDSIDKVTVYVAVNSQYEKESDAKIIKGMKARLGEDVHVDVVHQDRIEPEKSGKYRYVISRVEPRS